MHFVRILFALLLLISSLFSAQFKEYYQGNEPQGVEPQRAQTPAPQRTPTPQRAPVQQPAQQPAKVVQPQPVAQTPPANQPQIVQRQVAYIPPFYFGWKGNFLIKASAGAVRESRSVSVKSHNTGQDVYYKPKNKYLGKADGSELSYEDSELFFRPQIGVGYQMINEGDFWTLDYSFAEDISELLINYNFTFPERRISTAVPYIRLLAGVGHTNSAGTNATSLSFGLGAGAYHYISANSRFRLEYGVDFARREWLPINHDYGKEEWVDLDLHLYLGVAYKF